MRDRRVDAPADAAANAAVARNWRCCREPCPYNRCVDFLNALSRIVPFAFASGVNLYATVALVGVCSRLGLVTLPEQFHVFENPWIIGVSLAMYLIEFVADKVPWLDTAWDAAHTIVRPLGAALVAVAALGASTPTMQLLAALLGGSVALTTHLTKAGTRAVANTSPEPFTNWALSFGEDAFVVGLTWVAMNHPLLATIIAVALLVAIVGAGSVILRLVRRRFARRRAAEQPALNATDRPSGSLL